MQLLQDPGSFIIWFVVFLFSLSFHESAHAYISDRFGDDTGRVLGRITLNPLPHIDLLGTIVLPLIGAPFGWAKPVPVNPLNWREKDKANFWVSAAGPLSNVFLAVCFFLIAKIAIMTNAFALISDDTLADAISKFLTFGITLNIVLAVFNLFPIPPLDGSHMLESVLPYDAKDGYEQLKPYGYILLILLVVTGVTGYIIRPIFALVGYLLYL